MFESDCVLSLWIFMTNAIRDFQLLYPCKQRYIRQYLVIILSEISTHAFPSPFLSPLLEVLGRT